MDEGSAAAGLGGSETPKWMSPQWSLPCRVSAVTPTQVTVRKYNDPKKTVVVHKNKVRKFEMSKDPVLRSLTGDYLEIATPVTDTPEDSRKRPRRAVAPEDELAAQRVRELFGETAVGEEGREPS
ncbi:hypothetical protein GNI_085480 [Gregarina niphandrodes]|uniref:Uncharacterized protein n=1 Tax=Gregarina niphandrodes TaxID=110365 RepID=A0A023B6A7_GRENI|nr:hypothetical protein GNI_085480 [Gregarina niphandrodes]EZG64402.1 hypothetical protein GNI_085480 [Gregarina niphandrodes]|eukprot:XP_011130634.1 hypothetical protein GNI_085480 [Gregarina niphandrodes]